MVSRFADLASRARGEYGMLEFRNAAVRGEVGWEAAADFGVEQGYGR